MFFESPNTVDVDRGRLVINPCALCPRLFLQHTFIYLSTTWRIWHWRHERLDQSFMIRHRNNVHITHLQTKIPSGSYHQMLKVKLRWLNDYSLKCLRDSQETPCHDTRSHLDTYLDNSTCAILFSYYVRVTLQPLLRVPVQRSGGAELRLLIHCAHETELLSFKKKSATSSGRIRIDMVRRLHSGPLPPSPPSPHPPKKNETIPSI